MKLTCPSCAAEVPASSINVERMVAKCASCNEVFRFDGQIGVRSGRARVPRPASITVEGDVPPAPGEVGYRESATRRARGLLRIRRRWFRIEAIAFLFFAIVWDGFLAVWYGAALSSNDPPVMALFFPLIHVAVGVFITYTALTQLLNTTEIVIDGDELRVRHGPIPARGNLELSVDSLRQLFVRTRISRSRRGGTTTFFALCADVDGTAMDVVRGLRSEDEARYLEQLIEAHLAIVDDPSAGDV